MEKDKERRRHTRVRAGYKYFAFLEKRNFSGITREVSPYGVGAYCDEPVEPGQDVDIRIFVPGVNLKVEAKGRVIYCIDNPDLAQKDFKHLAGIQLVEGPLEDLTGVDERKRISRHTPVHSLIIDASPDACYRLLGEFARYPEWAGGVEAANVIENYGDGRGKRVEFFHDFFFRKVRYVLDYFYDDQNHILSWVNAGGDEDILTISGSYSFNDTNDGKTRATYELFITLSIIPSKRLVWFVTNVLMLKEMKNFKAFVEKNR